MSLKLSDRLSGRWLLTFVTIANAWSDTLLSLTVYFQLI